MRVCECARVAELISHSEVYALGEVVETGLVSETGECDQVQLVRPEVKECHRFCEHRCTELTLSLAVI